MRIFIKKISGTEERLTDINEQTQNKFKSLKKKMKGDVENEKKGQRSNRRNYAFYFRRYVIDSMQLHNFNFFKQLFVLLNLLIF